MLKRLTLTLAAAFAAITISPSPIVAAESIAGRWVTEERDAIVEIRPCGNSMCGTIARFLIAPPNGDNQRDVNNSDPNLRNRKILGLRILSQLREDDDVWRGQIYDPNRGRSFRSVVRRTGANTLEVSGCAGPFCQSQVWRKAN